MRKIIKLKGELLIITIISLIVSWIISSFAFNIYKNSNTFNEDSYEKALMKNNRQIELIKDSIGDSTDDSVLEENIKEFYLNHKNKEYKNLYLIDKEGNVIFKNNEYAISKFALDDDSINVNKNKFNATNIISINDNRSIVFLNSKYLDDNKVIILIIFNTFICFIILVYGRIQYINTISSKVRLIAKGKLDTRIPVKYKNELTALAIDVNSMAKELSDQDNKQKEFITNISHDLRTPLTTILGYVDMIEGDKYSDSDELKRYVSIIKRKSVYLKSMLEDFFCYSKLSSKDMKMNKNVINLNEGINQLIDGESEELKKLYLNVEVNICNENIYTFGDPLLISRAFENLVSNARKYSKKGSTIYVSLNKDKINDINYVLFKVRNKPDDPIEDIDIEKLFYRMYKSDNSRNKGGSGLGLAITKEIVENHNGFIKVKKISEYLEFTIALKEHVQN